MQHVRGPFPSFSRTAGRYTLVFCGLAVACACSAPSASAQTIYKWVDERGVVNYGNAEVPKSKDVSVVDTAPAVVVQPDARSRDGAVPAGKLSDAELLRQELARTRNENARLRQNIAQVTPASTARRAVSYAEWREECEAQRRVDCDEGTYALESRVGSFTGRPVLIQQPVAQLPKPVLTIPVKNAQNSPRMAETRRLPSNIAGTRPETATQ